MGEDDLACKVYRGNTERNVTDAVSDRTTAQAKTSDSCQGHQIGGPQRKTIISEIPHCRSPGPDTGCSAVDDDNEVSE